MDDDATLPPQPPTTPHGEPVPMPSGPGDGPDADPHVRASAAVANLRDVGGRRTRDGREVRRGVLFRSAELRAPAVADDPAVAALGVRTVVDLRTAAERDAAPDVLPAGARGLHADVLAPDTQAAAPAVDLSQLLRDPDRVAQALADLDPAERMRETYVELVVGTPARAGYAALLREVARPDAGPLLYHCTAGKDRTGWATTVLLLAAGVDEDEARAEYLAVNPAVRAMYAPMLDGFASVGGDPGLLVPLLEVRAAYLDAALEAVREHFGTFDAYLRDGLGLDDDEVTALRTALVG